MVPQTQLQCKSGVAVISGQRTRKPLFLGMCNKYCAVSFVSEKQEKQLLEHRCYHNWSRSYPAMESYIVLEDFRLSKQTHVIRYMRINR